MSDSSLLTWWHLGVLTKQRLDAMLEVYGDLDTALSKISPELLTALGCRKDTVEKTLGRLEEFDAFSYMNALKKRGIELVSILDAEYPARLVEIPDSPVFLSYKGDLSILNQPTIGLVGTRKMSPYGKRVTENFTESFVRAGMVTVSGLALGVDATVADATLRAKGKTVAALGHGLGSIYPQSNARLATRIVEGGGLLLSEFPLDFPPDKFTFPARNRIIAGLSIATVVLEAPEGSGAIITAELAADYGRDVFAVPGQVFDDNYSGSHRLIAKNQAKLVHTPEEVLRDLGVIAPERETAEPVSFSTTEEEKIYHVLTTMPQLMDDLVQKSKLEPGIINATLTIMELQGVVKNVGGGGWVRHGSRR